MIHGEATFGRRHLGALAVVPPLPDAPPSPLLATGVVLVDLGARQVTGPDGPEGQAPDPFRVCVDHRLFAGNR